jgi:hypothetical protein
MSDLETNVKSFPADQPRTLGELLARIAAAAASRDRVCFATLIEAVGSRAYGPVLLLIGIILFSPLSGIPGMPTLMGVALALTSLQMLCGRGSLWLPPWLLGRSVSAPRLVRGLAFLEGPVTRIDWFLRRRHVWLISRGGSAVVAILCLGLACLMPLMELVPFSATAAGLALLLFGLGMVAADGLFVLIGMIYLGGVVALALTGLL